MTTTAKILCVGVGNSTVVGSCAGADLDAKRMFDLFKKTFSNISYSNLLLNDAATRSAVVSGFSEICAGDESTTTVFFFAGHGGSQRLKNYAPEEADGRDEFVVLYDDYLVDDEIWNIISSARGRVFLVFDCCHSETMFRLPAAYEFDKVKSFWTIIRDQIKALFSLKKQNPEQLRASTVPAFTELLCWSGCADDKTSKGSYSGGVFTNAILRTYETNKSLLYAAFWDKLAQDTKLRSAEISKQTLIKNKNSENSFSKFSVFN